MAFYLCLIAYPLIWVHQRFGRDFGKFACGNGVSEVYEISKYKNRLIMKKYAVLFISFHVFFHVLADLHIREKIKIETLFETGFQKAEHVENSLCVL